MCEALCEFFLFFLTLFFMGIRWRWIYIVCVFGYWFTNVCSRLWLSISRLRGAICAVLLPISRIGLDIGFIL